MGVEIERKFRVTGEGWRNPAEAVAYRQGYIPTQDGTTVRVRIAGDKGYVTIKRRVSDVTRAEFEFPIPRLEAAELLDTVCARPQIEKTRTRVAFGGFVWEVDEFLGDNRGLVIAEIELPSESVTFARPDWVGEEVTHDARYTNAQLAKNPWRAWGAGA